ncbi:response regulator [Paraherbaspirillum soli]|uniref:Response regulator n=1 Tax=Paraherbaspirillum soli TaxID=631222 RepID=A0ABW0MCT4_9BURK
MLSSRILVVEDHPINRRMLQAQLAAEGWQSELVATGADALLWLAQTRPLAVITDYVLEDMTGVELLRQVRQWESGFPAMPAIPIILYSGMSLDYLQTESRGLDCTAILTKPISRSQLRKTLAPLLTIPIVPAAAGTAKPVGMPDELLIDLVQFGYQELAQLRLTIKNGDLAETARIAHGLRGAAAVLKSTEIANSSAEIENQSRHAASNTLDAACDRLQAALGQLNLQLQIRDRSLLT